MAERGGADRGNSGGYEKWWYGTFGIAAPLISSLVGLLFLAILILLLEYFGAQTGIGFVNDIGSFLKDYITLFFALMVFFSYTTYFSRFYHRDFVWVMPVISAFGITITIWIIVEMFAIMNNYWEVSFFDSIIQFFTNDVLLAIFTLVMVLGYVFLYAGFFYARGMKR